MRADEEGVKTGSAQFHEIVVGAQAGFADGNAIVGNAADQFEGSFESNGKRLEVAVVYADDARTGGEGPIEFVGGVNFDERLHAQLAAQSEEVAEESVFERRDDEQKAIRVVGASFPDLPRIEDKILAKDGKLDGFAGVAKIFQRAAEEFAFGEHGKSGSTRGFETLREGYGIERVAKDTAGGRSRLEFCKDVEPIAAESGGKIAERGGGLHAIFQGRLWQDALAMFHLGTARFENAVEHASAVGLSRHFDNFVC